MSLTIALAFQVGLSHLTRILDGVLRYARQHELSWSFLTAPESHALSVLDLKGWNGDGIIATLNTPEEARCAARLNMPVVNISSTLQRSPVPRVRMDHVAAGRIAAEHLLSLGFTRFGFYGLADVAYSSARLKGFTETIQGRGFECDRHSAQPTFVPAGRRLRDQLTNLRKWLGRLPKPCAVLAVTDFRARMVIDCCQELKVRVPQDIAVMGFDDYPVLCELSIPPLTSVHRNAEAEGFCAAEVLHRLMSGQRPAQPELLMAPGEVIVRASTDVVAFEDPRLFQAMTFIRRNLGRSFDIGELLEEVGVSRRWLEYTFVRRVGQTPHQYITAQRVARVRQILQQQPHVKLSRAARDAGFRSARVLSSAFRRVTGLSPRAYADQHSRR